MQLNYPGVFALYVALFYLSLVLDYRICIWKAQNVFCQKMQNASKCDKAGETTGVEIQGLPQM